MVLIVECGELEVEVVEVRDNGRLRDPYDSGPTVKCFRKTQKGSRLLDSLLLDQSEKKD